MIPGLYAAASGMMAVEERQAIIANNIANASTSGFKRQNAVQEGFRQIYLGALGTAQRLNLERGPGGGLRMVSAYTDYSSGAVSMTGNPLHLALQGPGFFAVETPAGERYTRGGALIRDAEGRLATPEGYVLMGEGGPITVNGGDVEFQPDGTVMSDNQAVGRLRVVEFDNARVLERYGDSIFAPSDPNVAPRPAETTTVVPGALESSNVQIPYEMAQMMLGLRTYNANQKVISAIDETVGRLINEVGMPT